MIFQWLKKAAQLISKDTGETNESPKLVVVIRLIVLSMLFYITANSIIYIRISNTFVTLLLLASIITFLFILVMTYHTRTKTVAFTLNILMLIWVTTIVYYIGWDIGVQHFIMVLLILSFFSGYENYRLKTCYAIILCAIRIYLYFLCRTRASIVELDAASTNILQIINTITIFWCISVIAYIFSKDSQLLEGKLVAYNNQLVNQANTDALTGLHNRRRAEDYLTKLINSNPTDAISIAIGDIDFFKKVNDNYGHDIGDIVLTQVAQAMKTTLGNFAFIARWGGEEFLIVFPSSNGDDAFILLDKLRSNIKAMQFFSGKESFSITMTFGLAEYDFTDMDTIIKEADEKLYMGKGNGRDQIVY